MTYKNYEITYKTSNIYIYIYGGFSVKGDNQRTGVQQAFTERCWGKGTNEKPPYIYIYIHISY